MKTKRITSASASAIIALQFIGAPAFAQSTPDELKQRIFAQAQSMSPDDYAFTRTTRTEQTSGGKTEVRVTVEKFDPSKSGEARWTLVSVDGDPPPADALEHFRKGSLKRRVPGYYRLAYYFGTPATVSTDAQGRTVFHFATLPKETLMVLGSDASSNAVVDATANTTGAAPFIELVHVTLKPMRVKLIAKVDRYESTNRYRIGLEGKPLLMQQVSDVSGSALAKAGQVHTVITCSDYRAVGKKP